MLILVGGGPAAGKATICREIEKIIQGEDPDIEIDLVCMKKWQLDKYGPEIDLDGLRNHLEAIDHSKVVLVHGKYALYHQQLRDYAQIKVFVDTDSDEQLSQWLLRDKDTREVSDILNEYLNSARAEFLDYIKETKSFADVLLPKGRDSLGARVISMNIVDKLRQADDDAYSFQIAKKIDLRRELFAEMDNRYYSAT